MRRSGSPSWQVSVRVGSQSLLLALYVREAAGLVAADDLLPRLASEIPRQRAADRLGPADPAAVSAWGVLWARLLSGQVGLQGLVDPETPAVRDLPQLRPYVVTHYQDALRWSGEAKRQAQAAAPHPLDDIEGSLVRELERSRALPAPPFHLAVTVLPVAGPWWSRVGPEYVLVSGDLRSHTDVYRRVLRPVVSELLDAT